MKKLVICLLLTSLATLYCVAENVPAAVKSQDNAKDIAFTASLIEKNLFKNQEAISAEAQNLSLQERQNLYHTYQKNSFLPLVLAIFPGFGIGSLVEGDTTAGLILLGSDLVAYGIGTWGTYMLINAQTKSESITQKEKETFTTLGLSLIISAATIDVLVLAIGEFRTIFYADKYNKSLANALGVTDADISIAPAVTSSGSTGLQFGMKFFL